MDTVKRRKQALHEVATIAGACDAQQLFSGYVVRRQPVKFSGVDCEVESEKFQIDKIVDYLGYDGALKVERRDAHGFGGGRQRQDMFLGELVEKLRGGDDSYYLTTQYEREEIEEGEEEEGESEEEEDASEEEDDESEQESEEIDEGDAENSGIDKNIFGENDAEDEDDENNHSDENDENNSPSSSSLPAPLHDDYIDLSPEEVSYRVRELFQPPLTPHKLPVSPSLFPTLVPQQINLWMGRCNKRASLVELDESRPDLGLGRYVPNGQSSGLHHDHADNLYILVSGRKRFTIFPPSSGPSLATVGTIRTIYDTGVIDYEHDEKAPFWRHIRDDGALETEVLRWKSDRNEPIDETVILQEEERLQQASSPDTALQNSPASAPPSFSTIPPALLHADELDEKNQKLVAAFASKTYPELLAVPRYTVWLQKGEMLYLPAGWFHEVTSFGDNENDIHIAINYWFAPPNAPSFDSPYKDNYWPSDFARTREAVSEWSLEEN